MQCQCNISDMHFILLQNKNILAFQKSQFLTNEDIAIFVIMITRQIHRAAPAYHISGTYQSCGLCETSSRHFSSRLLIRANESHPVSQPNGRPARIRALFTWKRVLVTLRLPAEKVSANDAFTRSRRVCTAVCNERILAPIPIHTSAEPTQARICARASRDRGGKFHSRIDSLANRFPA